MELLVEYMTGYENGEVDLQDDTGDNDYLIFNGKISGIFIMPGATISSNNTKKYFFYGRVSPLGVIYHSNEKGYDEINKMNFQQPYTMVALGYSIAAGADYFVEKHWHLFLEVTNKGTTAPNFWNAIYNSYIDLIGANVGIKYYLGKQA